MTNRTSPPIAASRSFRRMRTLAANPRVLKFAAIGASGVAVNLGALFLLVQFTRIHYAVASPLAIEASILSNYLGNRLWTWRDRRVGWESLLHFHGVSLVGMLVQWGVLVGAVELGGLHYLTASLLGIGAGTVWNFVGHHHFTFAHEESPLRVRLARPLLYASSFGLQLVLAALFVHAWDGFVFEQSVQNLLDDGETPYATIEEPPAYVYNRAYVPPFPEWYAYPPLALVLFALASLPGSLVAFGGDAAQRVLWKLPIIAASLALPYLARRYAELQGARTEMARRLELFLLFNPLLFVIGPMWGMTEPLLLAFLVASLLLLERNRIPASGLLFGLSALIKIFPLFVYPILLAHMTTRPNGWRAAAQHLAAAAGVWIAVGLPFFLLNPDGFLELVFFMHVHRPPAGFSLFVPLQGLMLLLGGPGAADSAGSLFSLLGLTLYFAFVFGLSLHVRHARVPSHRLPLHLGMAYLALLLSNKVVNEQYLLTLLGLVALAAYLPGRDATRLRATARAFSLAAATATLLEGFRLFQLLPRDVAPHVLGATPSEFILRIRQALGLTHGALLGITGTIAVTLLILAARPLLPILGRHVRFALRELGRFTVRLPLPTAPHPIRRAFGAFLLVTLIVLPPASVGLLTNVEPEPLVPPPPLASRIAGAYYYLWWENPSNDYAARYGNWKYATTTPLPGYYSSYTGEIESDVRSMKDAGLDFALVPLQGFDHTPFDTLAYQSERAGFRFAPLLDLATLNHREARVLPGPAETLPLTPETVEAIQAYINRYSPRAWQSPNLLRYEPGHPVVFLQGARLLGDPTTPEETAHLARLVQEAQLPDLLTLAVGNESWERHAELLTPKHFATAAAPTLLARFWDEARADAYADAWDDILGTLGRRAPGAVLVLSARDFPAPGFPLERVIDTFDAWEDVRPGGNSLPLSTGYRTIYPQYDAHLARPRDPVVAALRPDGLAYAHAWAEQSSHDRLLIHSWNEHQEATAIEPTWEWGDRFLDATARWSTTWHAPPLPTLN